MNSDTPRTDAQMESPNERTVPIDFARQLERELNYERAARAGVYAGNAIAHKALRQRAESAEKERDALRAELERLRDLKGDL